VLLVLAICFGANLTLALRQLEIRVVQDLCQFARARATIHQVP